MTQRRDYLVNRGWLGYCHVTLTLFLLGHVFPPVWDYSPFLVNKHVWSHFRRKPHLFSAWAFAVSLRFPQIREILSPSLQATTESPESLLVGGGLWWHSGGLCCGHLCHRSPQWAQVQGSRCLLGSCSASGVSVRIEMLARHKSVFHLDFSGSKQAIPVEAARN